MKNAIRTIFLFSTIVVSIIFVQGVRAVSEIETLDGIVTSVLNRAIGLDYNDDGETDETVYHMGPPGFWEQEGISYPEKGFKTSIDAYLSCTNGYVGVRVCYSDPENGDICIQLRDPDTLKPLWPRIFSTKSLFDIIAEAVSHCCSGCLCCDDCTPRKHDYHYNLDYNYDYNYNSNYNSNYDYSNDYNNGYNNDSDYNNDNNYNYNSPGPNGNDPNSSELHREPMVR